MVFMNFISTLSTVIYGDPLLQNCNASSCTVLTLTLYHLNQCELYIELLTFF